MTHRRRLPKSARLRSSTDIRAMFRSSERAQCGGLEVFFRPSTLVRNPRIAVIVPKHGRSIVERNRLRRRIRETIRTEWLPRERVRPECRDLLVRARPAAYAREFDELREELRECLGVE